MRNVAMFSLSTVLFLSGCSLATIAPPSLQRGIAFTGSVHGAQQPVVGARLYLLAANTTGYGQASLSLLNAAATGHSDGIGAYVLTGPGGGFTITNDYACTPASQVYLYAVGGNPGAGVNTAAGFLAIIGACPANGTFDGTTPSVVVNEISTIAAAYSIAGFATDATHVSSSGTPLAQLGIAHAFVTASNLASLSTGVALTTTPSGYGVVARTTINTLGNILASCINSTSALSANCNKLLGTALSGGATGAIPTDTATAAINIAHHAQNAVPTLFNLAQAAGAPFLPQLSGTSDFSITVAFTGGGITSQDAVAIDGNGDIWIADSSRNAPSLGQIRSDGVPLSPAGGYAAGCMTFALAADLAISQSNDIWYLDSYQPGCLVKFSSNGPTLTGVGITGGGLNYPSGLALDHLGNAWAISGYPHTVSVFSSTGSPLSPPAGYSPAGHQPTGIAVDASGSVWVGSNASTFSRFAIDGSSTTYTDSTAVNLNHLVIDSSARIWSPLADGQIVNFSIPTLTFSPVYPLNNFSLTGVPSITIDGASNVWTGSAGVTRFYTDGVTPTDSFRLAAPLGSAGFTSLAVDGSGNLWCANPNAGNVIEYIGLAEPVVTPLATASLLNQLGTRP